MDAPPPIIYALAQQYLQHRKIKLAHILTLEKVNQAISASGAGLDHTIGEQVIAVGDDSYRDEFDMFFMLTDRQLAGRVLHQNRRKFFNLNLFDLVRLHFDFFNPAAAYQQMNNADWLALQSAALGKSPGEIAELFGGLINLTHLPDALIAEPMKKPLFNLLMALRQFAVEQCLPLVQPLAQSTGDDPTGAGQALQATYHPECRLALEMITAAYKSGAIAAELGGDLTARVALANRTTRLGRGKKNGWWLSSLSAADLAYAFARLLGNPAYFQQQGPIQVYDFNMKNSGTGKALASSTVGLASAALLGVGWVSVPGKSINNLRVSLFDMPPLSGFAIDGLTDNHYVPLYGVRYELFRQIVEALLEEEIRLTLLRCAFGWQAPAHQLITVPLSAVETRLEELKSVSSGPSVNPLPG
jgi:hypothetical protein